MSHRSNFGMYYLMQIPKNEDLIFEDRPVALLPSHMALYRNVPVWLDLDLPEPKNYRKILLNTSERNRLWAKEPWTREKYSHIDASSSFFQSSADETLAISVDGMMEIFSKHGGVKGNWYNVAAGDGVITERVLAPRGLKIVHIDPNEGLVDTYVKSYITRNRMGIPSNFYCAPIENVRSMSVIKKANGFMIFRPDGDVESIVRTTLSLAEETLVENGGVILMCDTTDIKKVQSIGTSLKRVYNFSDSDHYHAVYVK